MKSAHSTFPREANMSFSIPWGSRQTIVESNLGTGQSASARRWPRGVALASPASDAFPARGARTPEVFITVPVAAGVHSAPLLCRGELAATRNPRT
jgi:hypothetical protein